MQSDESSDLIEGRPKKRRLPRGLSYDIRVEVYKPNITVKFNPEDVRNAFFQIAFDKREEGNGGPTRVERMMALDRLARMFGLYQQDRSVPIDGATLEQLLAAARQIEQGLPVSTPPLRLIESGKV